jgi:NADH-quinone oxidoreductase subunit C
MRKEKELKEEIERTFKDTQVAVSSGRRLTVTTNKGLILNLLNFVKNKGFKHLSAISCVDWIKTGEYELIYHISSYQDGLHIMLKTRISRDNPKFITVIPIFKNAQTYEREIWEMFGMKFEENPRLIPLFLDRWKEVPPFRKDFDTREYVEKTFGDKSS